MFFLNLGAICFLGFMILGLYILGLKFCNLDLGSQFKGSNSIWAEYAAIQPHVKPSNHKPSGIAIYPEIF